MESKKLYKLRYLDFREEEFITEDGRVLVRETLVDSNHKHYLVNLDNVIFIKEHIVEEIQQDYETLVVGITSAHGTYILSYLDYSLEEFEDILQSAKYDIMLIEKEKERNHITDEETPIE